MVRAPVRALLVPLALVGMLGVTGLVLSRIYYGGIGAGALMPSLLLAAAFGSVLISVLVRRLPAWTAAPCSMVGLAVLTLLAVRVSARAGHVPGPLFDVARDALRNGVPRLLTAMIPIEPQPDTVVVPVLATWLAGLAAAELALRAQRVLASYAAPTVLLGGALYLVGPNARPNPWLPLAFAGFAALGLAGSAASREHAEPSLTRQQRSTLRIRIGAGAAVGLAAIVGLATAVGPSVAGRVDNTPADPRRYVTPPRLDSLDENPLVRLSGWALGGDQQHLFDAAVSGTERTRIRLAVVSDYDGVTWRVGARYRTAGRILTGAPGLAETPAPAGNAKATKVEQRIVIDELDGRLLPGAATPQEVDGVRVAYDPSTGTIALPEGLHPGLAYTVLSSRPKLEVNLLPSADVPSGAAVSRFLALPGTVPAHISALAQQLGSGISAPYQRALAIEEFLSEHYLLVPDAPSGHSYPNLDFFLFGQRNAGGQRGTSEQFAAAFAVLGRALGLPTRVAVGFQVKAGHNSVHGTDALAWPEVLFTGLGWVDFSPFPKPNTNPRPVEEDFRPKPDPSNPPPAAVATPSAPALSRRSSPPAATAPAQGRPWIGLTLVLAGGATGVGAIGFLVAVPILRRSQRRRRLARGDPAARVAGAWAELLDGLRMAGRPALPYFTVTEVAAYATAAAGGSAHVRGRTAVRLPAPPIDDLANLANAVAFAPAGATETQAATAEAQVNAYVGELRARRPWWRRLIWTFDPRPLLWARVRGVTGAVPGARRNG